MLNNIIQDLRFKTQSTRYANAILNHITSSR
jgi:hypothetical protein